MRIYLKKQHLSRLTTTFTLFVSLAACGVGEAELDGLFDSDAASGASADASSDSGFSPDHDSDAIESSGGSDLGADVVDSADLDGNTAPEDQDAGNGPDGGNRGTGIPSDCTRALADEQLCDGIPDCEDATDERNCRGFICPTTVNWIPVSQLCDGEQNCTGGGDEADEICDTANTCDDGVGSFFEWDRCDLSEKCADGTDELNCEAWMCPDSIDPIVTEQLCDETLDCSTGADELVDACFQSFTCNNLEEIPFSQRCDGTPDCFEGEDEAGCGRFVCDDDGTIPASNVCDGNVECRDGSDEDPARCAGNFSCADGVTSVAGRQTCDGINDCPAGDDELNCSAYTCADGSSIGYDQLCDDVRDCGDGDDELVARCVERFTCLDSGLLIESYARCDGNADCEDGSDELDCAFFICSPRERVSSALRCDGNEDCEGGEDELSCEGR
jgi:hypothetical protein